MVFESIVADVLNKYLGEYVKDLDRSQLNVGIWGGNIVLMNLDIRETALEDLDLPMSIIFGHIGKLTIRVPWKSIYTSPTSVTIDGLYLLVMPKTTVKYDQEKEEKSSFENKQRELERIEKVKQQELEKGKEKTQQDDTFKEKLVMQVIKNLQIEIQNVHIRYEDNYTYPQRPFSFGITLSNLAFQTTDEDWIPAVMGQEITTYHKLANLEYFSFYWSCGSHLYHTLHHDEIKERMTLDIAGSHNSPKELQYVLEPVTAQTKMIINTRPDLDPEPFSQPKITLSLEIEQILLSIKDAQYADITRLLTTIEMMKVSSIYRKYKPSVPVHGNARLWWMFAINAILEEDVRRRRRNWSWAHIYNHRITFKNYKENYKVKLTTKKLSPFILNILEHCEKTLDVFNITVARRQAELEVEYQKLKTNEDDNNWSTWFGSWFSKPKRETSKSIAQQFEEVMSPAEKAKLYEAIGYQENAKPREYPETFVQHYMTFLLKDFTLIVNKSEGSKKIIEAEIDSLGICLSQRPSAQAIKVELKIQRMEINGSQGSKMLHPFLPVTLDPMISILYETNPQDRSVDNILHIKSHPMEFIYNADTINGLVDCFKPPGEANLETLYEAAMLKLEDIKELSATGLKHAIQQRKSLDMAINIMPSYIIIPENGILSENVHQLIINLGHFSCVSATLSSEEYEALLQKQDFDEITDLAFDKFTLTISNIGILLSRPGENWTEMLQINDSEIHLLRPTTVELKLEKAIITEDYRIPKIRFSLDLPQINLSFSEAKLTELLRLLLSIPTSSEEEEQAPQPIAGRGLHTNVTTSTQALKVATHLSLKEEEKKIASKEEIDSLQKQIVEIDAKFEINQLGFELYKLTDKKVKLLEGSFIRLGTKAVVRTLDFQVKFFLGEIRIQNHEFKDPYDNGPLKLISSPPFLESSDLITLDFLAVKGEGPHIKNLYNNVLASVHLHFTKLFIVMHLEAMLSLMAFANKLLPNKTSPPKEQVPIPPPRRQTGTPLSQRRRRSSLSSIFEATGHGLVKKHPKNLEELVTTMKIDVSLGALAATICQESCLITKLAVEGITASVAFTSEETHVKLTLQDIIVSNMQSDTLYTTILSTEAGQMLNLDVQVFNHVAPQISPTPPADMKVFVELGETRVVYLNSFINSLMNFGDHFQAAKDKMAEASMAAAEAAKFGMEQAYEKATRIGLQIALKAPLVVFPQNSHSKYALVLDLGTLLLHNKFYSPPLPKIQASSKNAPLPNIFDDITIELKDVMLFCCLVNPRGSHYITSHRQLIEPISFNLKVTRNLSIKWLKEVPEVTVSGKLHAIKMALSEEELGITMKMLSENMKEEPFNTPPPPRPKKESIVEKPQPKKNLTVIVESQTENFFTSNLYERVSLNFTMESFSLVLYAGKSSFDEKERDPANSLSSLELSTVKIAASMKSDNCLSAHVLFKDLILDDTRPFRQNGIRRLMQRNKSNENEDNNVMSILYEMNAAGDTTLNVTVSSFSMIVYLKYFLRLSEFFTQSLPKAPSPDELPKITHPHHKQEVKELALPTPLTTQTITFIMEKPDLVLIEDLDDINSSSLILNAKVFVRLLVTSEEQNISASIGDLELFTSCFNPQRRESTSKKILTPCNFNLHGAMKKDEIRLDLQLGDISIHVTPSTVGFLMNIMQGLTSDPKLPISEAPAKEESYIDIWESKKLDSCDFWFTKCVKPQTAIEATEALFSETDSSSEESSHHAYEQLLVHLDSLIITVESDFGKRTVPMLLLETSLASEALDWSSKLKVAGQVNLEMAYFNEKLGIWEPLLEPIEHLSGNLKPWTLHFELAKEAYSDGPDEIDDLEEFKTPALRVELKSKEYFNLTITKTALELLSDLNKSFQAALVTDETDKFKVQQGPFLVENHMGMNLVIQANNRFEAVGQTGTAVFDTLILEPNTSIHLLPVTPELTSSAAMHSLLRKQEVTDDLFFNIQIPLKQCPSCIRKIELSQASTRYYQLQQRSYPGDHWGFVVDITTSSGYKIINFRSPVQVKNTFSNMAIEVYYMMHTGNELVKCGTVDPLKTLHLPLHAVYTPSQELFFRPSEGNKYKVASQAVVWKDVDQVNPNSNGSVITCKHSENEASSFHIKVNKEIEHYLYEETGKQTIVSIGYQIVLSPPVIFRNLLPLPVSIKTEGLESEITIAEGHSRELWSCQVGVSNLQIKLSNYLGSQWTATRKIVEPSYEITAWTFTSNADGQTMDLGIATNGKHKSLELNLYCPFWMINSTGLSLSYKQGPEKVNIIHHPPQLPYPVLFSYKGKDFFNKKKAVLKVMESDWSDKFSMDVVGSSGSIIVKENSGKSYCVAINIRLGNSTALTKIITFSPFYILANNSTKPVRCRENYETSHWIEIAPKDCIPFWPIHNEHNPELQACYADSPEDVTAPFSYKEPHSTLLKLFSTHGGIYVECIFAEDTSIVIKFEDYHPGTATVLMVNHSVKQKIFYKQKGENKLYTLPPGFCQLYTWDKPTRSTRTLVWHCSGCPTEYSNNLLKDDISEVKMKNDETLYWVSFLDHTQRVMLFTEDVALATVAQQPGELEKPELETVISFQGLGISLVNNDKRLELLYFVITGSGVVWESKSEKGKNKRFKRLDVDDAYKLEIHYQRFMKARKVDANVNPVVAFDGNFEVDFEKMLMYKPSRKILNRNYKPGLWLMMKRSPHHLQLHCKINRLQIDNQLMGSTFPVLLAPTPLPKSVASNQDPKPFVEVSIMMRHAQHSSMTQFKYFKILIQEFHIKIAMGFIHTLLEFFSKEDNVSIDYAQMMVKDQELIKQDLKTIAEAYTVETMKNFYDYIHLSPIKIHVSFSISDPYEENTKQNIHSQFFNLILQSLGVTLTEVQDIVMKLNYFERESEFLSTQQLTSKVISHYSAQAIKQIYMLIFGLDVIGNPVGLIMGLTTGVGDFFYEPFQGLIQGPEEFAEGLALGVKSLFGHAVGGAAGSVSRITGTLGKGIAALTLDKEYQRKRRERLNARPHDISHNLAQSSKGLVMGVFEGITGVITKPIEGAQEEGIEGFFKGVGKGLIGVVARPTTGAFDFASTSLDAVKRATEMTDEASRTRPPRYIKPDKIIRPYRRKEAEGNYIFYQIEKGKFVKTDRYFYHELVAADKAYLFITNNRVMYVSKGDVFGQWNADWEYTFDELANPVQFEENSLKIMLKQAKKKGGFFFGSKDNGKLVHFRNPSHCKEALEKLQEAIKKSLSSP